MFAAQIRRLPERGTRYSTSSSCRCTSHWGYDRGLRRRDAGDVIAQSEPDWQFEGAFTGEVAPMLSLRRRGRAPARPLRAAGSSSASMDDTVRLRGRGGLWRLARSSPAWGRPRWSGTRSAPRRSSSARSPRPRDQRLRIADGFVLAIGTGLDPPRRGDGEGGRRVHRTAALPCALYGGSVKLERRRNLSAAGRGRRARGARRPPAVRGHPPRRRGGRSRASRRAATGRWLAPRGRGRRRLAHTPVDLLLAASRTRR